MKRREFITLLGGAATVAACGARAAGRADAAHRRAHAMDCQRCGSTGPRNGGCADPTTTGLDRWAKCRASTIAGATTKSM